MVKNFFALLQHPKIKALVTAEALLVCLVAAPQVAEAYLVQLTPLRSVNEPHTRQFSHAMAELVDAKPASVSTAAHAALLKDLLLSAQASERRFMVWSVYPASVRGRVFGGTGGDPVMNQMGGW